MYWLVGAYCAYEHQYVWPTIAKAPPGVQIDIVDASTHGGIGDPGPRSPALTGVDNLGGPIREQEVNVE